MATTPNGRPPIGRTPQFGGDGFSGHRARKRFGQNFLVDTGVIQRIVTTLAPQPADSVVEIGAGRGALTEFLVDSGCDLTLIEIDRDLAHGLQQRYPDVPLIQGDALRLDYSELLDPPRPFRVVGNLPYNISTPLMFHLLDHSRWIRDAHFLLQDEVVQRLTAVPGEKAWGRLGVMIQYRCQVERLFAVPAEAFSPRPQVRSRIVRLVPRSEPEVRAMDEEMFATVVRSAFNMRRKTLRNGLKSVPGIDQGAWDALEAAGVDLRVRPETLSVAEFVGIANVLSSLGPESGPSSSPGSSLGPSAG